MSLLAKVKSGVQLGPQTWVIHGPVKKGKTSLAAQFPKPIFADIDKGTGNLDVQRLTPDDLPDFASLMSFYDELLAQAKNKQFETVVTDSATVLQQYVVAHICKEGNKKSLGEFGHGDGYVRLEKAMSEWVKKQQLLKEAGYHVILVAHSKLKQFTDPIVNAEYTRYLIQGDDRLQAAVKAGFDNILFVNSEVTTYEDKNKTRAQSDGESYIFCTHTAAFDAGNRLNLPPKLPLSFTAINKAYMDYKPLPQALKLEIEALLERGEASKVEAARKAMAVAGNDVYELGRIKQKLATLVAV